MLAWRRRRQKTDPQYGALIVHAALAMAAGAGVVMVLRAGEGNAVKVVGLRAIDAKQCSKTMFHLRLLYTSAASQLAQPRQPAIH